MVLLAPDSGDVWDEALDHVEDGSEHTVTDDDGGRHERLWEWVAMKASSDSCWHLDSVGVEPGWQGRGIGSALIQFALGQARATNHPMLLETGTPRNVPLYQRVGFDIVEEDDAPEGGPHVWFMRFEP
jgi:GNAT superfamily N-acetyltransferase